MTTDIDEDMGRRTVKAGLKAVLSHVITTACKFLKTDYLHPHKDRGQGGPQILLLQLTYRKRKITVRN